MTPDIPKSPQMKTPAPQTPVSPVVAKVSATQPLPRQAFSAGPAPVSPEMISSAATRGGRYDPKMAQELLQRGRM